MKATDRNLLLDEIPVHEVSILGYLPRYLFSYWRCFQRGLVVIFIVMYNKIKNANYMGGIKTLLKLLCLQKLIVETTDLSVVIRIRKEKSALDQSTNGAPSIIVVS